jgi:AcrR family transcriptional regulator
VSNLPIWAKPAPGSRKPRFTREQIAAAALEVADKQGFAELSMRRVADALGAGTMTLYYYVRTKDDLLALMDDALMGEVVERCTPLPEYWRTALETIANAMRTVFLDHPWALDVEGVRVGPHTLMHIEQSLAAVKELAIPLTAKFEMLAVVDDFVFGSVLRDRVGPQADQLSVDAINVLTREHLKSGRYPMLEALVAGRNPVDVFVEFASYAATHNRFDRGLAVILDGFTAKYNLTDRSASKKRVKRTRRRTR